MITKGNLTYVIFLMFIGVFHVATESDFCSVGNSPESECGFVNPKVEMMTRYILYDVNPPEGFNLRRDVYMRIAIFIKNIQKYGDWKLILPPWSRLYHWQSANVGDQNLLPWGMFFDVPSLQKFIPVIEMNNYFSLSKSENIVQEVYVLQHYKDMWAEGTEWRDRWNIEQCNEKTAYTKIGHLYRGPFWGYKNISTVKVSCVSFQGHATMLKEILNKSNSQSIMFDHAEIALHDIYGEKDYWEVRRSMRFAPRLVEIAAEYRKKFLNSTDEDDSTVRPADWREDKENREARGGPYVAAHLRRKDFLYGRSNEVPDLAFAAQQIEKLLTKYALKTIFIATDAPKAEFAQLKTYLPEFRVLRFEPTNSIRYEIKDGGVAIVDQIICSHAKFFTGTHESTFSFRIQEEREIIGFLPKMTFNRLCGNNEGEDCAQPAKWKIVF